MSLSQDGRRLLYSFEGLHTKLSDGRYAAYLCPAGRATIYAGCTTGVRIGMVVTAEEGERMVDAELAKFDAAVSRLVTVDINTHERDACLLLSYNIGIEGFARSGVLRQLNKGNKEKAAKAFAQWNKAHVHGKLQKLPGLTSRRAREAALFLKPTVEPDAPFMPQAVAASSSPLPGPAVAASAATLTATASSSLPDVSSVPQTLTSSLDTLDGWHSIGERAWNLFSALPTQHPAFLAALAAGGLVWYLRQRAAA